MIDPVLPLHGGGDMRYESLLEAILEVLNERGSGLPIPGVLGVLRLVEKRIFENQDRAYYEGPSSHD